MSQLPRHLPALDGLRGIAILMVVLTHVHGGWGAALSIYRDTSSWSPTFAVPDWVTRIGGFGVEGVTLFFVVSAFTLTLRLAERRGIVAYALHRVARVGPAYWLAGLFYTLLAGLAAREWAPGGVGVGDLLVAAVFGSAWQGGASMAVVPGGWSVSCEVSFYLVLPVLLRVIGARVWLALILAVVAFVAVQGVAHDLKAHAGWHFTPEYINPLTQAPVFLAGIAAAVLARRVAIRHVRPAAMKADRWHESHISRAPPANPRADQRQQAVEESPIAGSGIRGLGTGLLVFGLFALPFSPVGTWIALPHLPFAAVMAGVVLLSALDPPAILVTPLLVRVGQVSYSMYLVHFALLRPSLLVAEWLAPGDDWQTLLIHLVVTVLSSFGVACVTHRFIERPPMRWIAALTAVGPRPVRAAD